MKNRDILKNNMLFPIEGLIMALFKALNSIFEKKLQCSKLSNHTIDIKDKLTLTGYVGKFNSNKYLEGQVLFNLNYVNVLAHIDDVTNEGYNFSVIEKNLESQNIYKKYACTKSVPNEVFNYWIDFMENFKQTKERDDNYDEVIITKRFKKYFKVQKSNDRIKLIEVQCFGIPKSDEIAINDDEFFSIVENIAYEHFGDNFDLDYDGSFEEGWAAAQGMQYIKYGDMSIEDKKKYKTQTCTVFGTDKVLTITSTDDSIIQKKVDFKEIAFS